MHLISPVLLLLNFLVEILNCEVLKFVAIYFVFRIFSYFLSRDNDSLVFLYKI